MTGKNHSVPHLFQSKLLIHVKSNHFKSISIFLLQVHSLAEEIGKKLAQAEEVGAEGKVEESIKLMEEVRKIKYLK